MQTIWKFPLKLTDRQMIKMPSGAKLLSVQMQGDQAMLWAQVDTERTMVQRSIVVYGTGTEMQKSHADFAEFIDTVQMGGGALVLHVFDFGQTIEPGL